MPPTSPLPRSATRSLAALLTTMALLGLGGGDGRAAPEKPAVVAVLGTGEVAGQLAAAAAGARIAAARASDEGRPTRVEVYDDLGSAAGLTTAVRRMRSAKVLGVVAAPAGTLEEAYWKAARSFKVPWLFVTGVGPDLTRSRGNVWHLAPSPAGQGLRAADLMLAPLAARRVGVVHDPSPRGRAVAATFARGLSAFVNLAGVEEGVSEDPAEAARVLNALEADWIFAAVSGASAVRLARALQALGEPVRCLFADGNRSEALLELAGDALEGSVFLGGPDPELQGRLGEDVVTALEGASGAATPQALRAFEATRRLLDAARRAGSKRARKVCVALDEVPTSLPSGPLGVLDFQPYRGVRFFPYTLWQVVEGRFDLFPESMLPTAGCGPPLGFGRPVPAEINERRGRLGYLTFGQGEERTIEQDLLPLGLSTGGAEPDIDEFLRTEILSRAIRIAHRLFRREPDGTPIPGWSWGMTFTAEAPPEDLSTSRVWIGLVAGDHPAAGGQVIGDRKVAIYSTFLERTMYIQRKLEPPVSAADRILFDGTYRWGDDRSLNFRANKIRCLLDGFASAVGLTLTHEFGHLCGCGHDTEHPASIMNVVAGAGKSWEEAVWIPRHQKSVTTTLGLEGVR